MSESDLLRSILLAYGSRPGIRLFRNSTGLATDRHGNGVRFGLCVGSADIIGWYTRGGVAVFTALEVKTPTGRLTAEQSAFLEAVRHAGGLGACVRSVEDAGRALGVTDGDEARSGS